jgi:hypothetical protein
MPTQRTTLEQVAEMLCGPCKEEWHPLTSTWGRRYYAPGLTVTLEGGDEEADGTFDFEFKTPAHLGGYIPVRCYEPLPAGVFARMLLDAAADFLSKVKR